MPTLKFEIDSLCEIMYDELHYNISVVFSNFGSTFFLAIPKRFYQLADIITRVTGKPSVIMPEEQFFTWMGLTADTKRKIIQRISAVFYSYNRQVPIRRFIEVLSQESGDQKEFETSINFKVKKTEQCRRPISQEESESLHRFVSKLEFTTEEEKKEREREQRLREEISSKRVLGARSKESEQEIRKLREQLTKSSSKEPSYRYSKLELDGLRRR